MGYERSYVSDLTFCGDTIEISIETSYCGCCGPDHDTEYMPISYLWDEEWQKEIPGILAERKKQKELKEAQQKKRAEERAREAELKKLAELKAKYEED